MADENSYSKLSRGQAPDHSKDTELSDRHIITMEKLHGNFCFSLLLITLLGIKRQFLQKIIFNYS